MSGTAILSYHRGRWPEEEVPEGEPFRVLYEIDKGADAVLRSVDIFPDGRITRNSVELEQRNGDHCPSLIDTSLEDGFADADLEEITREDFEQLWRQGIDEAFWFPASARQA